MSKAEIIEELAHLSPEDLADVRTWLDRVVPDKTVAKGDKPGPAKARIRTPRLANPAQSADFAKKVIVPSENAGDVAKLILKRMTS